MMNSRFTTLTTSLLGAFTSWLGGNANPMSSGEAGQPKAVSVGDTGHIVVGFWAGARHGQNTPARPTAPLSSKASARNSEELFVCSVPFRPGSHEVEPYLHWELHQLCHTLRQNSGLTVSLSGHADACGTREKNRQLAERRVATVSELFVRAGIEQRRIFTQSHGKLLANYCADDSHGCAFDRRVLIRIGDGEREDV